MTFNLILWKDKIEKPLAKLSEKKIEYKLIESEIKEGPTLHIPEILKG